VVWLATQYDDSQQDMRELARYAESTVLPTRRALAVDIPALNSLAFYLKDKPVQLELVGEQLELRECYVAVGGARSFWWSRDLVFDPDEKDLPRNWTPAYEVSGQKRPWRPSNLRVYYAASPNKEAYALFDEPLSGPPSPVTAGLSQAGYPGGFDAGATSADAVQQIPDLDNSSGLPAAHLEWIAWLQAEDDLYTFESDADDGSWIYLNERLLLDDGGIHPAKMVRRRHRRVE
jgi:hypothetical protein